MEMYETHVFWKDQAGFDGHEMSCRTRKTLLLFPCVLVGISVVALGSSTIASPTLVSFLLTVRYPF